MIKGTGEHTLLDDKPHKQIHNAIDMIESNRATILHLARAFNITGNRGVAETLWNCASDLDTASEAINSAVGDWVDENLKQSQQHSETIFKSVMAGKQLAKEG